MMVSAKLMNIITLYLIHTCTGDYHCPVTLRVFNENSHIVAIRISGNVYSYEVCERGVDCRRMGYVD